MIMLGERSLYDAIQEYLAHSQTERTHHGLANHLIAPEPDLASHSAQVRRRERLGGVLSSSHRAAA